MLNTSLRLQDIRQKISIMTLFFSGEWIHDDVEFRSIQCFFEHLKTLKKTYRTKNFQEIGFRPEKKMFILFSLIPKKRLVFFPHVQFYPFFYDKFDPPTLDRGENEMRTVLGSFFGGSYCFKKETVVGIHCSSQ